MGGQFGIQEDSVTLKNQVCDILSKKGILQSLKAQMRAAVLSSLNEDNMQSPNPTFDAVSEMPYGKLAVDLIAEFLDFCQLKQTYTVFEPEAHVSQGGIDRISLAEEAKLSYTPTKTPVLLELLKQHLDGESGVKSSVLAPKQAIPKLTALSPPPSFPLTSTPASSLHNSNHNPSSSPAGGQKTLVRLQTIPPPPPLTRSGSSTDSLNFTKAKSIPSPPPLSNSPDENQKSTETIYSKPTSSTAPGKQPDPYAEDDFEDIAEDIGEDIVRSHSESEFVTSDRSITPTRAAEGLDYVEAVERD